jgi:RNA polymerase sigma-70 factor (ECF subfamily)
MSYWRPTCLRAWRFYEGFEGRSSVRMWLYHIATNACLSALTHKSRRLVPSAAPPVAAGPEVRWLQPIPDAMLDPATIVEARDSLRIALIATLQPLPGPNARC